MRRREFLIGTATIAAASAMPMAIVSAGPITIPVTDVIWDAVSEAEYLSGARPLRCTVRRLDNGELFSWTIGRYDRLRVALTTYHGQDRAEITIMDAHPQ